MAEAKAEGIATALLLILQRRGLSISSEQQRDIIACTDLATLERWLDRALSVTSVDALLA